MTFNITQCNITDSQIGENNIIYKTESLTENDWICLERLFEQKLKEFNPNSEQYQFLNKSKKYISNKDKNRLINFIKKHSIDFLKNVFYNISSTEIVKLISKIGVFI